MDTNRIFLRACIASLAICVTGAGAQTIYKQIDPEGRVIFTDQPNPGARVVASYETARPARRPNTESEETAAEPARRPDPETSQRAVAPFAPIAPVAIATSSTTARIAAPDPVMGAAQPTPSPREA